MIGLHSVERMGVFSPITTSGLVLVGGVQASCYGDFYSHIICHAAMTLARWFNDGFFIVSEPPRAFLEEVNVDQSSLVQFIRRLLPFCFRPPSR